MAVPDVYILEGHSYLIDPDEPFKIPEGIVFITAAICGTTTKSATIINSINHPLNMFNDAPILETPFVTHGSDPTFDIFYEKSELQELLQSPIPRTPAGKLEYRQKLKQLTNSRFDAQFTNDIISDGNLMAFAGQFDADNNHIYARHSGTTQLYTDHKFDYKMRTIRSGNLNANRRSVSRPLNTLTYEDIAPLYAFSEFPTPEEVRETIFLMISPTCTLAK